MALLDVRPVYVVQDRDTGAFVDINMQFCTRLKNAAFIDSREMAVQHTRDAVCDGLLEFTDGFEVVEFYVLKDCFDR